MNLEQVEAHVGDGVLVGQLARHDLHELFQFLCVARNERNRHFSGLSHVVSALCLFLINFLFRFRSLAFLLLFDGPRLVSRCRFHIQARFGLLSGNLVPEFRFAHISVCLANK